MIRLDAIPFMWKESGTTCVHRPETHAFVRIVRALFDEAAPHVLLLSETNVPHEENITYFGRGGDEAQLIYNFSLAPLILYGMATGDATPLAGWAKRLQPVGERCTFLNITSTHDGIGMRPTEGILDESQRKILTDLTEDHGGLVSYRSNPDGSLSPYELNITFYDAINNPNDAGLDDATQVDRFLLSQAIPMALMGMPGVYIHCLLGSRNDLAGRENSGIPRRINREKCDAAAVGRELDEPRSRRRRVFEGIQRLLAIRRKQPAFHPQAAQTIVDGPPSCFIVRRECADQTIIALHNLGGDEAQARLGESPGVDLLAKDEAIGAEVPLAPWQVRWIRMA